MPDVLTLAYVVGFFGFVTGPMLYLAWHDLDPEDDASTAGS